MAEDAIDTKQVKGLFYSKTDKKLFYIPRYYTNGTGMLETLRKNLSDGESIIRRFVAEGEIYCDEIRSSRRYKSMWCFSVSSDVCPDEAYQLGDDWTMQKWLEA